MSKLAFVMLLTVGAPSAPELYKAGAEAYSQGRYEVAIEAFEEVLRVDARPFVYFTAAQAHRLQYFIDARPEHLSRAVHLYRAYLKAEPAGNRRNHASQHLAALTPILDRMEQDTADGKAVAVKTRIIVSSGVEGATASFDGGDAAPIPAAFEVSPGEHHFVVEAPLHLPKTLSTVAVKGSVTALNVELDPSPGQVEVRAPDGADVHVDGREVGATPLAAPLSLAPGRHLLAITERGRESYQRRLDVGRGTQLVVEADLDLTGQRIAAWAVLGTGAVLLAAAGTTLALTLDRESEARGLEDRHASSGLLESDAARYQALEGSRDDFARATIGLSAAAGAVGVLAALLFALDEPEVSADPRIMPLAGPGAAGIGLAGEF